MPSSAAPETGQQRPGGPARAAPAGRERAASHPGSRYHGRLRSAGGLCSSRTATRLARWADAGQVSPHERSRPLNGAGRTSSGQLNPADPGQTRAESQPTGPPGADAQGGRLRAAVSYPALRHLVLLAVYVGAGIAATWPLTAYLVQSRLPRTRDVA